MLSVIFGSMSRSAVSAASLRTRAIGQHMISTTASMDEPSVKFESNNSLRTYILNRPKKLNALDDSMLRLLRPKIEEWDASDLCGTIVGTGAGRAFCAGGDVASVVNNAEKPETRQQAVEFFKQEFELDYILASLNKPYVAILDGTTMGGGVGLAANAPFRVATEKTVFAMPETKIGYCPDVGASYFLSRMDGEIGTYLALTGESVYGRAVFEHGLATHFIPSRRVPMLLERLAELDQPHASKIDLTLEELSSECDTGEPQSPFIRSKRVALDATFRHNNVEDIINDLTALSNYDDETVRQWALDTITKLHERSPTSLKVALEAVRRGRKLSLREALEMEFKIACAFCNGASPDFKTGVNAVLVHKAKTRPDWSPSTLSEVSNAVTARFFDPTSPYLSAVPHLELPQQTTSSATPQQLKFALPSEKEIELVIRGSHKSAGDMGSTYEEVQSFFAQLRPGKHGVREKVQEVVERKCAVVDNADGNFVWLKWNP